MINVSPGESGSSMSNLSGWKTGKTTLSFVVRRLRNVDLGDLSGLIGRSLSTCPLLQEAWARKYPGRKRRTEAPRGLVSGETGEMVTTGRRQQVDGVGWGGF